MSDELYELHEFLGCHEHKDKVIELANGNKEFLFICDCGHVKQKFIMDASVKSIHFRDTDQTLYIEQVIQQPYIIREAMKVIIA